MAFISHDGAYNYLKVNHLDVVGTSNIGVNSIVSGGGDQSIIASDVDGVVTLYGLDAGTGIELTTADGAITISATGTNVNLASAGGTQSLVSYGTGPDLTIYGLTAGDGISLEEVAGGITIAAPDAASSTATYITSGNESSDLPNSLQLVAGSNITLTPGVGTLTVSASGTVSVNDLALQGNTTQTAVAAGTYGVALGHTATVGVGATAGVAIGEGANTFGAGGITIGSGSENIVNTVNSIVIGVESLTTASNAIVIGNGAEVNYGSGTVSDLVNGIAIGTGAFCYNTYGMAIGNAAIAGATYDEEDPINYSECMAIGVGAIATGNSTIAIGTAASSGADFCVCIGNDTETLGTSAVVVGNSARVSYNNGDVTAAVDGIAIGDTAMVYNTYGIAIGSHAASGSIYNAGDPVTYPNCIALGGFSVSNADSALALGAYSSATGSNSIAIGSTDASGSTRTSASGEYAIAMGHQSSATASSSGAIGVGTVASQPNAFVFGSGDLVTPVLLTNNVELSVMLGVAGSMALLAQPIKALVTSSYNTITTISTETTYTLTISDVTSGFRTFTSSDLQALILNPPSAATLNEVSGLTDGYTFTCVIGSGPVVNITYTAADDTTSYGVNTSGTFNLGHGANYILTFLYLAGAWSIFIK